MMKSIEIHEGLAEELRQAFDESFEKPAVLQSRPEVFLVIRVGQSRFGVRLTELSGVCVCRKIVPMPGEALGFLGLSGVRGMVVAVHSLASVLGVPAQRADLRWLMLPRMKPDLALGLDAIETRMEVMAGAVRSVRVNGGGSEYAPELVDEGRGSLPILSIPSLVRAVLGQASVAKGERT